ncbi:hypothetical protein EDF38_2957 [Frigoribacterium sp. PhB160]|nr:hypothetical protein EDF38_2957 [Frigoribacterium sp. PhB160]
MHAIGLRDGQVEITGLSSSPASVAVWRADPGREISGWHLDTVDLSMKDGRPFGYVTFVEPGAGREAQVAVRWDHVHDQLQCFATDRNIGKERGELERDVRHRVGALMAAYAQLGLSIATSYVAAEALRTAANLAPHR